MDVSQELTRQVAHLARLELSEIEVRTFTAQLSDILGYVDQLQEVRVEGIEPLTRPFEQATPLREDVIVPSLQDSEGHPKILAAAPDILDDSFKVPPIL